ncbi:MAG: hypothetical protein WDN72_05660 [Alphaproteobacteria bacterium]
MHIAATSGVLLTGGTVHSAVLDADLSDPHVPMKAVLDLSAPGCRRRDDAAASRIPFRARLADGP